MALPTKFADLDQAELYRSAIEDFAIDVKKNDSKKALEAAFLESGVEWSDYAAQHPEVVPEPEPEPEPEVVNKPRHNPNPAGVVTSEQATGRARSARTLEPERAVEGDIYLIKM